MKQQHFYPASDCPPGFVEKKQRLCVEALFEGLEQEIIRANPAAWIRPEKLL